MIALAHPCNLPTRSFSLPTPAINLATRAFSVPTRKSRKSRDKFWQNLHLRLNARGIKIISLNLSQLDKIVLIHMMSSNFISLRSC